MLNRIDIEGCELVKVGANSDERGCLYEIFRETWPGAFRTVQWNACSSAAGVVRGVHVHADYHEFYTLPMGSVKVGLTDIRRSSPTFGKSVQFEWSDADETAVVVPIGVAHVVYFIERSVLAFGLSGYWRREFDLVGCRWDEPELGFDFPCEAPLLSERDAHSGSFQDMITDYERIRNKVLEENSENLVE